MVKRPGCPSNGLDKSLPTVLRIPHSKIWTKMEPAVRRLHLTQSRPSSPAILLHGIQRRKLINPNIDTLQFDIPWVAPVQQHTEEDRHSTKAAPTDQQNSNQMLHSHQPPTAKRKKTSLKTENAFVSFSRNALRKSPSARAQFSFLPLVL